jgi:amino acid transporter
LGCRAAAVLYTIVQVGLQGVVLSPAKLQAHCGGPGVHHPGVRRSRLGQGHGGRVALSVIATTGVGIALTARILFGMASWKALPGFLANVSRRFATPVAASIVTAVLLLTLFWVYILGTSLANVFGDLLSISSWLPDEAQQDTPARPTRSARFGAPRRRQRLPFHASARLRLRSLSAL